MDVGSRVKITAIDGPCDKRVREILVGMAGTIIKFDKSGPEHEWLPLVQLDNGKRLYFWESELREIDADGNAE